MGGMDTWDSAVSEAKVGVEVKKKYVEAGILMDDGVENAWALLYEDGNFGHLEMVNFYDPADPASRVPFEQAMSESNDRMISDCLGIPFAAGGDRMADLLGPHIMNYHHWLRKIKKTFDPNVAADPAAYIRPKE